MSTLKHLRALENSLAYRACQVLPDDVHQCRRLLILINHVVEHEEEGVGNAGACLWVQYFFAASEGDPIVGLECPGVGGR